MNSTVQKIKSIADQYAIQLYYIFIFLIVSSLTRLILIVQNFDSIRDSFYLIPLSLVVGVIFDLLISFYVTLPLTFMLLIFPARWKKYAFVKWVSIISGYVFLFGVLYLAVAEIIFFGEFSSQFNYVAVDYLIYPHEVFINIWDMYPVLEILIGTGIISFVTILYLKKNIYHKIISYSSQLKRRFMITVTQIIIIVGMTYSLGTNVAKFSNNRVLNEIGLNGVYTFFYSFLTNELAYDQYYVQRDKSESLQNLKDIIVDEHATFLQEDDSTSIARHIKSDNILHRYNIVLVLEESFGSNFIGSLHPEGPSLTPSFDSLTNSSYLFTHIYATGNRTVRGLEASLASFPPIPGRSIVKRPNSDHVFTLSSVLKSLNYNTIFLYGGLSYFDNFQHFASTNSFDRIIDEVDFKHPEFKTIWGVSDEDLFSNALQVFDTLAEDSSPFFATLITVSNHSPYTYPSGHISFDPNDHRRENAVRYADYAIGKFIQDAKSHSYYDSTLFIFVADHGARVYGSEEIPLNSYEIPILFHNSQLTQPGKRIDILGSQMDLAPTILDFLGIEYNSMFFGKSLLSTPEEDARVLMSHNRDVSLLKHDTLVVLNIQGGYDLWYKDSLNNFIPIKDSVSTPLIDETISYYMTAYDMYLKHSLHPLSQ